MLTLRPACKSQQVARIARLQPIHLLGTTQITSAREIRIISRTDGEGERRRSCLSACFSCRNDSRSGIVLVLELMVVFICLSGCLPVCAFLSFLNSSRADACIPAVAPTKVDGVTAKSTAATARRSEIQSVCASLIFI
jgi:hypothetical protein